MKIPNHFDLIAPFYEMVIPAAHTEELVQIGNFPVAGLILDIGGGTGRVAKVLAQIQKDIIILDSSHAMLRMAKNHHRIQPLRGNAEQLPFPRNYFERVMMIDSFHHLADHRMAINEAWRVLKPNGILILQEPDIEQWGGKAIAIFEKALFMRSHLFSAKRVLEMLDDRNHQSAVYKRQQFYWLVIQKNPLQN